MKDRECLPDFLGCSLRHCTDHPPPLSCIPGNAGLGARSDCLRWSAREKADDLSISFYSNTLTSQPCCYRRDCPSQGSIPNDSKWLNCKHIFHIQTNQSRVHNLPTLPSNSHSGPLFLHPDQWGPGTRHLGTAPTLQNLAEIIQSNQF